VQASTIKVLPTLRGDNAIDVCSRSSYELSLFLRMLIPLMVRANGLCWAICQVLVSTMISLKLVLSLRVLEAKKPSGQYLGLICDK
jgi:hypothetical protein